MADKEKKKKTKKKEEAAPAAAPEPEPPKAEPAKEPTPPETPKSPSGSNRASRGSRKVKRSGSSVFSCFTQKQVAEFKEGFGLMDHDKDGVIGKEDLRFIFDQVGRIATEKELDDMVEEAPQPLNFTQLLTMFASRLSGGSDDDETVIKAFMTFDVDGKINGERFRHSLLTFGDKFVKKDVDEAFDHFYIDDKGFIDTESLINMLTGKSDEDE